MGLDLGLKKPGSSPLFDIPMSGGVQKGACKIWKQSILANKDIEMLEGNDMLEVWYEMSKKLCKTDLELLGAIWWVTWNARNQLIFEGKKFNPSISAAKAQAVVEAFHGVKQMEKTQDEKPKDKRKYYSTPTPQWKL